MIDHVRHALAHQCNALVVVGRDWPGLVRVDDLPRPGEGPLGGLLGAMRHARLTGYDTVLTSGCDLPALPHDLRARLGQAPAVIAGQPLLGLWPANFADRLEAYLAGSDDRSMRGWIAASGARRVAPAAPIPNINTARDLRDYLAGVTPPAGDRRSSR